MFLALSLQCAGVVVTLLASWFLFGQSVAVAVSYGSLTSMVNTSMLVWRWHKGLRIYHCDGSQHVRSFYRSSMERFFVIGILLAAGFGLTDLVPEGLLAGFIVGQFTWAMTMALSRRLS